MKLLRMRIATPGWISVIAGLFISTASAQTSGTEGVKNVVLVHGAWADGSSWSRVIPRLREHGLNVVAVQIPLTSLSDDVATTERAIALQNGPVLLVGHSYGGVVITEAGNDPKVAGLVFVAAYAPDTGESAMSMGNANKTPVTSQIVINPGFLSLTPQGIDQDFAPDLSNIEKEILTATQGPWGLSAYAAPVNTPAWKNKPTWFVIASNDRVISPTLEHTEAQNMHATTIAVPTSHVAMLAAPEIVAAFIAEAAEAVRTK